MEKKYFFHSSCFDKDLFQKQLIILNDHGIDYKIINVKSKSQFRAPLSSYFEAEIHVLESDFAKAEKFLSIWIE